MSYDMWIGTEGFNITYNLGPMFRRVYPELGIRAHYGLKGYQAVEPLRYMRNYFEENRDELLTLEPSNKWGSYEKALQFIDDLIQASLRNTQERWYGD